MSITNPEQAGAEAPTPRADYRRALQNYLATGQIEWHADARDAEELRRELHAEAHLLANEPPALLDAISGSLAQRTAASLRLLQLLPSDERTAVLACAPLQAFTLLPSRLPQTADVAVALLPAALQRLIARGVLGSYLLLRVQALVLALRNQDLQLPLDAHIVTLLHECLWRVAPHASTGVVFGVLQMLIKPSYGKKTFPMTRKRESDAQE